MASRPPPSPARRHIYIHAIRARKQAAAQAQAAEAARMVAAINADTEEPVAESNDRAAPGDADQAAPCGTSQPQQAAETKVRRATVRPSSGSKKRSASACEDADGAGTCKRVRMEPSQAPASSPEDEADLKETPTA